MFFICEIHFLFRYDITQNEKYGDALIQWFIMWVTELTVLIFRSQAISYHDTSELGRDAVKC